MALNINTNLTNNLNGYLLDAKNVKGTYVVVEEYSDLADLPEACLVEGTLAYVQSDTNYDLNSSLYRYKGNADWEKVNFGPNVRTKSLGLINPNEPTTFTVTSEELPYSFLTANAPECFLISLALGNINNMFGIYFTNYAVNANRYGVPSTIQYTTLFYYNNTQYLVVLTIDATTPLQENNATLSFREIEGGGGGTTQTKTIYEFTLKTSTDGNAIGTDNYNEMYVEISEEKYQEYLTELNQIGRATSSSWQDIHTADEAIAFIRQSFQSLPGAMNSVLIFTFSLLVNYSLKENRNPYANLHFDVRSNYEPYTSYAVSVTMNSQSLAAQVRGGDYFLASGNASWFDIDDMYPETTLQLSSNSTVSYTTRQESTGSGGGETKKWYNIDLMTNVAEEDTGEIDSSYKNHLYASIDEEQMAALIQEINADMSQTLSNYNDLISLYNSLKRNSFASQQEQANFNYLTYLFSKIMKLSVDNGKKTLWEQQYNTNEEIAAQFITGAWLVKMSSNIIGVPQVKNTKDGGTLFVNNFASTYVSGDLTSISFDANSTLTITEETETISGGGGVANLMTEVTYSQFVSAVENNQLIHGMKYKITDYVTKINGVYDLSLIGKSGVYLPYATSAEHPFNLIVEATGVNTYNENVKAEKNTDYTVYWDQHNNNLEAWELKWTHLNDRTKYSFADAVNGKGVIYYMKDEFNNEACYDFKNIQNLHFGLKQIDPNIPLGESLEHKKDMTALSSNVIEAEFTAPDKYVGYFVYYQEEYVLVTEANIGDLEIEPGVTLAYTKQPNRYGDLLDVFSLLQFNHIGDYVHCFWLNSNFLATSTNDYIGYYVKYQNKYVLVGAGNKDSLNITPGTTNAYKHSNNLRFVPDDIPGTSVNPMILLAFIRDVSKETLDSAMNWTYMLAGLSQVMGTTVTLATLAQLLGTTEQVLSAMTERQVIQVFFDGYFYYTFDALVKGDSEALGVEDHWDLSLAGAYCQENKIAHTADVLTYYLKLNGTDITVIPNGLNVITFQNNDYMNYKSHGECRIDTVAVHVDAFCFLATFGGYCSNTIMDSNIYGIKAGYGCYANKYSSQSWGIILNNNCRYNNFQGYCYNVTLPDDSNTNILSYVKEIVSDGLGSISHNIMEDITGVYFVSSANESYLQEVNGVQIVSISASYVQHAWSSILNVSNSTINYTNDVNIAGSINAQNVFHTIVDSGSNTLKDCDNITIYGGNDNTLISCNHINLNPNKASLGCQHNYIENSTYVDAYGYVYNNTIKNVTPVGTEYPALYMGNFSGNNTIINSKNIRLEGAVLNTTIESNCSYITINSGGNIKVGSGCNNVYLGIAHSSNTYSGSLYYIEIESGVSLLYLNKGYSIDNQIMYKKVYRGVRGTTNEPKEITIPLQEAQTPIEYKANNYVERILN